MLTILPAPDHVCAMRIEGTLGEADLDRAIADIEGKLKLHEKLGLLADITGFDDMTLKAGWKDIRYGFGKILEWKRFSREAVVTDSSWVETLVSATNPVIPFVEVRCFKPAEFDAALAWASDIEGGPNA